MLFWQGAEEGEERDNITQRRHCMPRKENKETTTLMHVLLHNTCLLVFIAMRHCTREK